MGDENAAERIRGLQHRQTENKNHMGIYVNDDLSPWQKLVTSCESDSIIWKKQASIFNPYKYLTR